MNYFMPVEAQIKLCNYKTSLLRVSMATTLYQKCDVCVCVFVCEFLSFSGRKWIPNGRRWTCEGVREGGREGGRE